MFFKKNTRSNEQRQDVDETEFVPYACHYDSSTLLTKNGELLQTIKITGFLFESVAGKEKKSLRRTLREAIAASIPDGHYAIWFHTVRRKKNLLPEGAFNLGSFEDHLNRAWAKRHAWEDKYVNELYITLIYEGVRFPFWSGRTFMRSLNPLSEKKYHHAYLSEAYEQLNATMEKLLASLEQYGAARIGIVERDGISYSEPIQFFGKIMNLVDVPRPAPIQDISSYLPTQDIAFGFNALECYGKTGRHFASMLSVKEYHEVTSTAIDRFLQLDQEFIITETFDFIHNDLALKKFEHQSYILSLSGDERLSQLSGLKDVMESNRGTGVDFGEHQITMMLLADSLADLEARIADLLEAFGQLGIVAIREDVMMEDCFWAQLPGNFAFLRRLSPINTARVGGFASLYNFPAGRIAGNHWGPAVTVFHTRAGTPYFFNFHYQDNGHTTIIGPHGAGKTVLLNFLVAQARKFSNKLFFFDQERSAELFIRASEGKYCRLLAEGNRAGLKFNPLRLADTPGNRIFLKAWLHYLLMDENLQIPPGHKEIIAQAVDYNFRLPPEQRKLSTIAEEYWPADMPSVTKKSRISPEVRLGQWYGQGKYAGLFDNDQDEWTINQLIYGFDMTEAVKEKTPLIPLLSYLFYRIAEHLDGTPAIIVLDEAWSLVDNPIFAPGLPSWLDELTAKNCMVIFATEAVDNANKSGITSQLIDKMATQIYLPNPQATEAYQEIFGLDEEEFKLLKSISRSKRELLLKRQDEAVVASLDLAGMHDIIGLLSGTKENIVRAESLRSQWGEDIRQWLPKFMAELESEKS